jgi:hypothetical protein
MQWVGLVAHLRDMRNAESYSRNLEGRDHFKDLGTDGRIILKWMLRE